MGYLEFLRESAQARQSIVCFGMDPMLEQMPERGKPTEERIVEYFSQIVDATLAEKQGIGAIKPNYAYFAQYGFDGLRALKALIDRYSGKLPIIFDGKRGDIGRSSEAYAKEVFDFWGADAATVSPYMGADSVAPFLERCKGGKGAYILCKTSNSGSEDFQMLPLDNNKPLFLEVARKIERWHVNGIGAVIGATEPDELEAATWAFYDAKKWVPFLVPGVGAQGGSAGQTARTLRVIWSEAYLLHRINSSSAIAYAYKKKGNDDPVGSALSEIARMNAEIGKI